MLSLRRGNLARLEVDIESIQHRADGGDVYALYQMAEHIYDRQIKTNHRPDYFVHSTTGKQLKVICRVNTF